MRVVAFIVIGAFATCALADANPNDFARGFRVNIESGQPLVHVTLPDEVYQISTTPTLSDVTVFNADGAEIPHAICRAPEVQPEQIQEQSLPLFESNTSGTEHDGANVEVQTTSGTHVNVDEQNSGSNAETRFLIDARGPEAPIRAITFDWSSSDHASEVRVSIETSGDLDAWRTVVPETTLLRAKGAQTQLRRDRVPLPTARYGYLRVRRVDGGPLLQLQSVEAEVVIAPVAIEPVWVVAEPQRSTNASELFFDSGRVAPIDFVRLRIPLDNYSVSAEVATRTDDKGQWVSRWSGESYVVTSSSERRESDPVKVQSITDRYWSVRVVRGTAPTLSLELGYRPNILEFVTQGAGPYTVAFGSRRADHASSVACGSLLGTIPTADREKLIAEGMSGVVTALGGQTALQAPPRKTPTRLIILWGSLLVGVGVLVAMAVSLIKRLRSDPPQG